jgi:hypothetical protein
MVIGLPITPARQPDGCPADGDTVKNKAFAVQPFQKVAEIMAKGWQNFGHAVSFGGCT